MKLHEVFIWNNMKLVYETSWCGTWDIIKWVYETLNKSSKSTNDIFWQKNCIHTDNVFWQKSCMYTEIIWQKSSQLTNIFWQKVIDTLLIFSDRSSLDTVMIFPEKKNVLDILMIFFWLKSSRHNLDRKFLVDFFLTKVLDILMVFSY